MKIIGMTGGVGCGKSRVLHYVKETFQAVVCEADAVAKELQEPGGECLRRIAAVFGPEVLLLDGHLDRAALSGLVFGKPEKLTQLNAIVHPAVKAEILRRIKEEQEKGTALFVIEAALLLDDGYEAFCDEVWYIYASREARVQRLMQSRGYTKERIRRMMASQKSEEDFRKQCTRTIDNSGNFEDTCSQVKNAVESIYWG